DQILYRRLGLFFGANPNNFVKQNLHVVPKMKELNWQNLFQPYARQFESQEIIWVQEIVLGSINIMITTAHMKWDWTPTIVYISIVDGIILSQEKYANNLNYHRMLELLGRDGIKRE
ncbi:hypothetical protein ACJX0J_031542, partial [Zea mays]